MFWLTPLILWLGHADLVSARRPRLVRPFLQRIAGGTQEVASLGVLPVLQEAARGLRALM